MTRRAVALALVRTPPLRPSLRLPSLRLPSLRRPSGRALAIAGGVLAGLLLAYAVARETSAFEIQSVELTGASPEVAAATREALRPLVGTSLMQIDAREVERRLARLSTVQSASVDRSFPHALRVRVVPEQAVAVYRNGTNAWLVAESGRVVAAVEPWARARLPRIRIPEPVRPAPGQSLPAPAGIALAVIHSLPRRFPTPVLFARVEANGEAAVVVQGRVEIRLGEPTQLRQKLAAAGAVLRTISVDELATLAYLDASLAGRVVAGMKSQPVSES